ncbi:glucosyl transferase [Caudoviricetes sp.]|nr:glucosyl transferase [Caudoviricetes sp.]
MIQIIIPTMGRATSQHTLRQIPESMLDTVTVVAPAAEKAEILNQNPGVNFLAEPNDIVGKGIALKRQFIIEQFKGKIIMLDDDLTFFKREELTNSLIKMSDGDYVSMITMVDSMLESYAHGGISAREGNNRIDDSIVYNTRLMRALAYNTKYLRDENVRFDRIEFMSDFDVNLQMLRKGYENFNIYSYAQDQKGSNAEGGCATYRNVERHRKSAFRLKELHHDFVKVVQKSTKVGWGVMGTTRTDVNIQWKKAFNYSLL